MKKILIIMVALVAIVLGGCEKETLIKFDESISGNSIYFRTPFLSSDTVRNFTFGFSGPDTKDTVLTFAVAISGTPANKEREFTVVANENSTLIPGVNYDFVDQKFSIPANKVNANIKIKFYRTPDITTERKYLHLHLKTNENFNTNVKNRITTSKDTLSLLDYYFAVDDLVTPPYPWSAAPYKTALEFYLGTYSKVKLQLLIELFEIDPVVFTDQKYAKENYFTPSLLGYWGSFMKLWLSREAAAGRVHKDENGVVIAMGSKI